MNTSVFDTLVVTEAFVTRPGLARQPCTACCQPRLRDILLIISQLIGMAQTSQVANTLTVVPFTLVLYDYAITLGKEKKPMSMVTLIYLALRYLGMVFMFH
ncbi:hypothetical protein SCLCIDRAFT_280994 [Scleroderma citrinum Foug A]|uniref:DUF6533 domain-containing protein n=1 Tax=Scleroderma citrinum Foug A TaxID=1036808 RepID=A0A0C2Z1Y3_9AGAM|nr:hypothetical protein SCLCIDRAFT_280994 [Scleroderma citrinum Foug A]